MLHEADIAAMLNTIRLAGLTTISLLILGTPPAYWLAMKKFPGAFLLEAVISLPLVLPPTVLGFYLLIILGPAGFLGGILERIGAEQLVFSFKGLLIASIIYSLPFVIQPLKNAFAAIGRRPSEAAATLGAGPLDRFFTVVLPAARNGFISAAVLGFAHTIGEFGVVLMIGGNIPGRTRLLSIAIYEHTAALEYARAHTLSIILLIFSFVTLSLVHALGGSRSTVT